MLRRQGLDHSRNLASSGSDAISLVKDPYVLGLSALQLRTAVPYLNLEEFIENKVSPVQPETILESL